jgi:hypothetical protein
MRKQVGWAVEEHLRSFDEDPMMCSLLTLLAVLLRWPGCSAREVLVLWRVKTTKHTATEGVTPGVGSGIGVGIMGTAGRGIAVGAVGIPIMRFSITRSTINSGGSCVNKERMDICSWGARAMGWGKTPSCD